MRFFKRRSALQPTYHAAVLYIKNDHFGVDQAIDLSHFDYEEMTDILKYIDFKSRMQGIEDADAFDETAQAYRDFEDE